MNRFKLALRLLWRDGRSGELTILFCALIIAVSGSTTISLFTDRLQATMNRQAAEFLAADLVISSPQPITSDWLQRATEINLKQSQAIEFSSVLMENNELLLSSVKAVTHLYPLRGHLKISDSDDTHQKVVQHSPLVGQVWVEQRVLSALKLKLGDSLTIGDKLLNISQILTYEPDKQGDFYSLSPRVLMNEADLAATRIIQPGSRVRYFYQFSGEARTILQFKQYVKPYLNPSQRLVDIHEDRPEIGNALTRAERYLGLSSTVVILIAGVAIAMATRRYSERHFDSAAILRCLGCRQYDILGLFIWQFLLLGMIASSIGCVIGWISQKGLFYLLQKLLPAEVVAPSELALLIGWLTGLIILFGFALPPLLRLKKVSALRVLRRDLEPLPSSAWLVYGLALSLIGGLIGLYTQNWQMTTIIIGGSCIALFIIGSLIYFSLQSIRKLLPYLILSKRFALQSLLSQLPATISQILAFSLTLTAMILTLTVRNDLLIDWQKQLPIDTANHFVLNIFPNQLTDFQTDLKHYRIPSNRLYPMVSGRLVAVNGEPIQQRVIAGSEGDNATRRDLSLTWSATIPPDNKIVEGEWWSVTAPPKNAVSIEMKLANSLRLQIGDQLTFSIGNQTIQAFINNIRSLEWDTMRPNFFVIFSPESLNSFPNTYLTSFYLPTTDKQTLNLLVKKYPNITVLEVDLILMQLKSILAQLTAAINYILYFAVIAGFTVLFAAVYASLDQRIYQGALMRTLGASTALLHKIHLIEFLLLGFISGLLAVIMSQLFIFTLYHIVLELDYQFNWRLCLITPLISSLFVTLIGFLGVYNVVKQSPLLILRQSGI